MIHEENGQIIVDELRPMSDAPRSEWIIVLINKNISPAYLKGDYVHCNGARYSIDAAKGFIPMPIYRPKDGA